MSISSDPENIKWLRQSVRVYGEMIPKYGRAYEIMRDEALKDLKASLELAKKVEDKRR
jgi:hypothetical protein